MVFLFSILVIISGTSCQDHELLSDVDIFHVWDTGLEGNFYINPPETIHSWIAHISLDQPMDTIEAFLCDVTYHKDAEFTCENFDWDGNVAPGDYFRVGFIARNNGTRRPLASAATYYIEGINVTMGTPPTSTTTPITTTTTPDVITTTQSLSTPYTTTTEPPFTSPTTITTTTSEFSTITEIPTSFISTKYVTTPSTPTSDSPTTTTTEPMQTTPSNTTLTITDIRTIATTTKPMSTMSTQFTTAYLSSVCYPNPCVHGNCTYYGDSYRCECELGAAGRNCEKVLDPCVYNPCYFGECVPLPDLGVEEFVCNCALGYTGHMCEIRAN